MKNLHSNALSFKNKKALSREQLKNISGNGIKNDWCSYECCSGKPMCPDSPHQCLDVVCQPLLE